MLFDSLMLARIAHDIRSTATGARVQRVFAPTRDTIALELRRKVARPFLVFCWSAEFGRAHFAADVSPDPRVSLPLGDAMRKQLRGAAIVDCRQAAFDRVLRVEFANCAGLGPDSRTTLVAEIMGRHGNLLLLDSDGDIIECAKHVDARVNRYRQTLPGLEYIPPPLFDRLDPHDVTPEALRGAALREPDSPLGKLVRGLITGCSDALVAELQARSGLDWDLALDLQPDDWASRTCGAFVSALTEAESSDGAFLYFCRSAPGCPEFAYPLELESRPDLCCRTADDLSDALEALTTAKRTERRIRERQDVLRGFTQRALRKVEAREHERERTLTEAEDAEHLRRSGELILANIHAIPPRASEVRVVDFYEPDLPEIVLSLDPNHSPQANAQALFERYKRAQRILKRVPPLLQEARERREYLEGVLDQIEVAECLDELAELEHELSSGDFIGDQAKRRRTPPPAQRSELGRFTSVDGHAVIFGRTGTQNDAVLRAATGDDLWFHIADGPGGHVVVRTGGNPDAVPEATIRQAAAMAAALSRWRADARADVNYTLAKHVRKRPGAPPGFVTYSEFRSITVTPRDAREP